MASLGVKEQTGRQESSHRERISNMDFAFIGIVAEPAKATITSATRTKEK